MTWEHPFLPTDLPKLSEIEDNTILEIRGYTRTRKEIITQKCVLKNDIPDFEEEMRQVIGHPGIDDEHIWMHVRGIVVSKLIRPLFLIEKYSQNKIKIINHVNFKVLEAYNYLKKIKKETASDLQRDKEYEIESAAVVKTSYGKKIELFLFDKSNYFKILLPIRYEKEIENRKIMIYKGTRINNYLDIRFKGYKTTHEPLTITNQSVSDLAFQNKYFLNEMLIINNDLKMQDKLDLNTQAMINNQQLFQLQKTKSIQEPQPQIINTKDRNRKVRCEKCSKEISYTNIAKHKKLCL